MLPQSIHAKEDGLFTCFDYPENVMQQIRRPGEFVWRQVGYEGLGATERYTHVPEKNFRNFKNPIDDFDI